MRSGPFYMVLTPDVGINVGTDFRSCIDKFQPKMPLFGRAGKHLRLPL